MIPLRVSVNRTSSGQRNSLCAETQVEGVADLSKEYTPDCRTYCRGVRLSADFPLRSGAAGCAFVLTLLLYHLALACWASIVYRQSAM
jgi:hypothetical protein